MDCKRKKHSATYHYINGYKAIKTANYSGGVVIFVKKRLFGFLWWIFVKDDFGSPISFNKFCIAEAFMNKKISYYDHVHFYYSSGKIIDVRKKNDEDFWKEISQKIELEYGTNPDIECVKKAWEFEGKNYLHIAIKYASLWHFIYIKNGKKLWTKEAV